MSSSTAANENGSYFEEQLDRNALNPFAAFELRADDLLLTQYGTRLHFKLAVKHVFESGDLGAKTSGPGVPLWKHLTVAKDMLFGDSVSSRAFERLKKKWGRMFALVVEILCPLSLTLWCPLTGSY